MSTDGGATFSDISGATSTTYSFTASSADNGNEYQAVFSNGVGTAATTAPATLTVDYVATQPANQIVIVGGTATFTAASSNPADTVQWQISSDNGATFVPLAGATSTTLSFAAISAENGYQLEAVFSNSAGTLTSNPATLTVDYITTQPANQTVNEGGTASFTVASSNPTDTVQWQVSSDNGATFTPISGATSTTYSFTASAAQSGYEYQAILTNSAGSLTSNPATLMVA
jgi:hypothetical protein